MSRWLAEGYVQDPHKSLKELIERNIIRPIDSSKNTKVKTCRAHGIMHEFMLCMSKPAKFITSFGDPEKSMYRHIFTEERLFPPSSGRASKENHGYRSPADSRKSDEKTKNHFLSMNIFRSKEKKREKEKEKLRAHSLTICGNAGTAVDDFPNCELLRVLDLEECDDLKDEDIDDLYLWHLKYLSLGATISRVPKKIEKLHCLETLDMRKTKIETLPVEVLKLPNIAHLFGKFKLEKRNWNKCKPENALPKKSKLQTLAGFVTDDDPGFPVLMVHMKKLTKVKIWCNSTVEDSDFSSAIQNFLLADLDTGVTVRSLSLYFGRYLKENLSSLCKSLETLPRDDRSIENREVPIGCLRSFKLHGALRGLTQFVGLLHGLEELCLSSTDDLTNNELSVLRKLECLKYLKLVKVSLGDLVIKKGHFPRLTHLCLVKCTKFPEIEEEALPGLLSLRLLDEDLERYCQSTINIRLHKLLQELGLDSKVHQGILRSWEEAAMAHPKRPRVRYFQKVEQDGEKYVPTQKAPRL